MDFLRFLMIFEIFALSVLRVSKTAQEAPKTSTSCPKRATRGPQDGPKTAEEGPQTAQQGPKMPQESPKTAQESPKTAQESPKTAPRQPQDSLERQKFRSQICLKSESAPEGAFGAKLEACWDRFGASLELYCTNFSVMFACYGPPLW